jgi:RHS repeat-associated protein
VHYTGPGSIGRQREGNYSQGYRHTSEAFSEGYKTLSANEFFDWDRASNALPKESSRTPWAQGRVVNNRVVVWQDLRYEYDALGRMTQKEKGAHTRIRLHWNCENQLIRSQGQSDTVYHYDALGRRIAKEDRFACTWFVWSGMRLQQEERGERVQTWVYESAEADEAQSYVPLARIEHGFDEQKIVLPHVQFLHTNSSGAPEELTSHQGDVLWQARYKVWGNLALEEWRENVRNYMFVTPEQNLRFQGQYADAETGLHYNTFRYYDPDIGRFASQDPIGLAGGVNLYQYGPNPISWIDPWGWSCGDAKEAAAERKIGTIFTRTTKNETRLGGTAGEPGVKIVNRDGTEFDMTRTRVKETELNPYVPGGTRPVKYKDALNTQGTKRAPTPAELHWFDSIKW